MATIARSMIGMLRLKDDCLVQATSRNAELENELMLAKAYIRLLEAKLQKARSQQTQRVSA